MLVPAAFVKLIFRNFAWYGDVKSFFCVVGTSWMGLTHRNVIFDIHEPPAFQIWISGCLGFLTEQADEAKNDNIVSCAWPHRTWNFGYCWPFPLIISPNFVHPCPSVSPCRNALLAGQSREIGRGEKTWDGTSHQGDPASYLASLTLICSSH